MMTQPLIRRFVFLLAAVSAAAALAVASAATRTLESNNNNTDSAVGANASTSTSSPASNNSCGLCRDGAPVGFPDKPLLAMFDNETLDFLFFRGGGGEEDRIRASMPSWSPSPWWSPSSESTKEDESAPQNGNSTATCSDLDQVLIARNCSREATFGNSTEWLRLSYAGLCGCPPPIEGFCQYTDERGRRCVPPNPDIVVRPLIGSGRTAITCGDLVLYLAQHSNTSDVCGRYDNVPFVCGCGDAGEGDSSGSRVMLTLQRVSGSLSFVGSTLIVVDILFLQFLYRKEKMTVFRQLMLGLSISDALSSCAWALVLIPAPSLDDNGEPSVWTRWGARGNDATCTAQGFFIQLGMLSLWYNMALSVYYLLVIRYNWREFQLGTVVKWLHALPLVVGGGLAFAGIPFYQVGFTACWIWSPFNKQNMTLRHVLFTWPVCTVLIVATVCMVSVYLVVRKQAIANSRWHFGSNTRNRSNQTSTAQITSSQTPSSTDNNGSSSKANVKANLNSNTNNNNSCDMAAPATAAVAVGSPIQESSGISSRRVSFSADNEGNDQHSGIRQLCHGSRRKMSTKERMVFWQCVFYLGAFYITWPIQLVAQVLSVRVIRQQDQVFWDFVMFLVPSQGIWNFFVSARPRLLSWMNDRRRDRSNFRSFGSSSSFWRRPHPSQHDEPSATSFAPHNQDPSTNGNGHDGLEDFVDDEDPDLSS